MLYNDQDPEAVRDYKHEMLFGMMEAHEAPYGGMLLPHEEYLDGPLLEVVTGDWKLCRQSVGEGLCTETPDQRFRDAREGPPHMLGSRFVLTDAGRQALAAWRAEKGRGG